jgi:hypothetical protein
MTAATFDAKQLFTSTNPSSRMAALKQGRDDAGSSPRNAWAVGARGDRIATFGSLAGCCAQAHAIIAGLGTENNAAAIATLPMNVHRSIIE